MSAAAQPSRTRRSRGTTRADRPTLSPAQIQWLGALLLAAQFPQAPHLPIWVAVGTHLVFGWTMALMEPLGEFTPFRRPLEQA